MADGVTSLSGVPVVLLIHVMGQEVEQGVVTTRHQRMGELHVWERKRKLEPALRLTIVVSKIYQIQTDETDPKGQAGNDIFRSSLHLQLIGKNKLCPR